MSASTKQFQPEVEGLRAIAVLAVLFFHLGIAGFGGGFVGVDMFFVISGYLITKNITRDLNAGKFSLKKFYITRIYRLLPALMVTITVTLIASFFILTPEHFSSLGRASIASIFSVSNIQFWFEAGYFDEAKMFKPLLHTWSLGVEEQFYLLWPLLLAFLFPKGNKFCGFIILLLLFISMVTAQFLLFDYSALVFYWMPFRVGEFAIGAILVFLNRPHVASWWASLLALLGMVLTLVPITLYSSDTLFPGPSALIPCFGTALLIHFSSVSIIYPLLANKLFCKLGKISYSLYLVHWPIIVLVSYWKLGGIGIKSLVVIIPIIFIFAWLLHSQIEQRFRLTNAETKSLKMPYGIIGLSLVTVVLGASISIGEGWSWRYSGSAKVVVNSVKGLSDVNNQKTKLIAQHQSTFNEQENSERHYIIGDSFAEDTMLALKFLKPSLNLKLLKIQAKCQPVLPSDYAESKNNERYCNDKREKIYSNPQLKKATTIYLAASWREPAFTHLDKTLKYLNENTSANIIVFGPRASFHDVPTLAVRHGKEEGLNEFVDGFKSQSISKRVDRLNMVSSNANARFIDLYHLLCPNKLCEIISPVDKKIIYSDYAHLTISGASYLAERLSEELD